MNPNQTGPLVEQFLAITHPLERAIAIAVEAHKFQVDKGGNPYVLHPLRVMMSLNKEEEKIVGVLHDVVEDCAELGFNWEFLQGCQFNELIIDALASVTKSPEEEQNFHGKSDLEKLYAYLRFVQRAMSNPIGKKVKRADIFDNLNVSRIGQLTPKDMHRLNRYKHAIELLDSPDGERIKIGIEPEGDCSCRQWAAKPSRAEEHSVSQIKTLLDTSHDLYDLNQCWRCLQYYLRYWHEDVDWEEGHDYSYSTARPISHIQVALINGYLEKGSGGQELLNLLNQVR